MLLENLKHFNVKNGNPFGKWLTCSPIPHVLLQGDQEVHSLTTQSLRARPGKHIIFSVTKTFLYAINIHWNVIDLVKISKIIMNKFLGLHFYTTYLLFKAWEITHLVKEEEKK